MQPQSSGDPRILRCPHCGAPLDLQPYAPLTQCRYCGHTVKLQEQTPPRPVFPQPTPYVVAPSAPGSSHARVAIALAVAGSAIVGLLALVTLLYTARSSVTAVTTPPKVTAHAAPAEVPTVHVSERAKADKTTATRYPLSSLLGVDVAVDIDGSRALMQRLFPAVSPGTHGVDLSYTVPLSHPWFGAAELIWQNEKAGKLINVGLKPPIGDQRFKNQKEIGDCLVKGLGKADVRETDHLKGEISYFWGKHFPRVWANLYSGYLWLVLEDPKGVPPITLAQIVRTLDGCHAQGP